ncbi:MAG: phosphoribosylanthranilate isomerase [Chloroflexi bacterium]|nr:MAG: phosphoribosylanthranilate isomerase [Chloroflexota bacterium]
MTRIKVCGNTRAEDVDLAVELGVDLLGFIFTSSKRQVHVDQVKTVIARVPDTVERVGVFVDEPPEQIAEVAEACGLTAVQVYRPLTAKDRSLGLLLLPAFRVQQGEDLSALRFEKGDHPLLDTWAPDTIGGTGRAWAWSQAKAVARRYPVVVSGGLNPDNVGGALLELHPWAVDVCSGVEAEPGRKDHRKLRAFVEAVRRVDRA